MRTVTVVFVTVIEEMIPRSMSSSKKERISLPIWHLLAKCFGSANRHRSPCSPPSAFAFGIFILSHNSSFVNAFRQYFQYFFIFPFAFAPTGNINHIIPKGIILLYD